MPEETSDGVQQFEQLLSQYQNVLQDSPDFKEAEHIYQQLKVIRVKLTEFEHERDDANRKHGIPIRAKSKA